MPHRLQELGPQHFTAIRMRLDGASTAEICETVEVEKRTVLSGSATRSSRLSSPGSFDVTLPETLPDLGVLPVIGAGTVAKAVGLGVVAVGVAPLLTARRVRRMDVPSTLRVVE